MANLIRLFFVALFRHWWAMMSCAAFTLLGISVAATNKGNAWVVGGSAVFAAIFFVVAAFRTWRDEYTKYTDEAAKSQKPEIKGEAFDFSGYGNHGEGYSHGKWGADTEMSFRLYLCNHRPVTTNLKAICLDGCALVPPLKFVFLNGTQIKEQLPDGLPHGLGHTITVKVTATADRRLADIAEVMLGTLKLWVIDAFGHEHEIRIRPGERLIFGQR